MSSLDHIGITTATYDASRTFYEKALATLGIAVVMQTDEPSYKGAGFGRDGKPDFWLSAGTGATTPLHVAFAARDSHEVDAFYKAAMAAGGRDNGGPGLRPHYHPNYYAAFVFDPDGNNIEAVFHGGVSP